jgi:hypothetical protein
MRSSSPRSIARGFWASPRGISWRAVFELSSGDRNRGTLMAAHPKRAAIPPLVAALDQATEAGGVSALDPSVSERMWQVALVGPAATFLAHPGKDLRARLVRAGWLLAGGSLASPLPDAIARVLEILHAGSLIVDDVEDQSEQRRGQPALHRVIGEPLAINTGSWMYFWALAELARLAIPNALELAVATLVRCHQGQALDLAMNVVELDMREVPGVVAATTRLKTGALCRLAVELSAGRGAPVAAIVDFGEAAGARCRCSTIWAASRHPSVATRPTRTCAPGGRPGPGPGSPARAIRSCGRDSWHRHARPS